MSTAVRNAFKSWAKKNGYATAPKITATTPPNTACLRVRGSDLFIVELAVAPDAEALELHAALQREGLMRAGVPCISVPRLQVSGVAGRVLHFLGGV